LNIFRQNFITIELFKKRFYKIKLLFLLIKIKYLNAFNHS
jgi:hypothetical protein